MSTVIARARDVEAVQVVELLDGHVVARDAVERP